MPLTGNENSPNPPTETLNSAVDKAYTYRTTKFQIEQAQNLGIKYTPPEQISVSFIARCEDANEWVPKFITTAAETRNMNPLELLTLLAVVNPDTQVFAVPEDSSLRSLDPQRRDDLFNFLGKQTYLIPDFPSQVTEKATQIGLNPGELLRQCGGLSAELAATDIEGGIEALRQEVLSDLGGDTYPQLARIERIRIKETDKIRQESAAREAEIKKEMNHALTPPELPSIETPPPSTPRQLLIQLAATNGVDFTDLPREKQTEIEGLNTVGEKLAAILKFQLEAKQAALEIKQLDHEKDVALEKIAADQASQERINDIETRYDDQINALSAQQDALKNQ